jgi:hypothetical protein
MRSDIHIWLKPGKHTLMNSINLSILLQISDTVAVDTTGIQYRIGYYIGSFLPFIVIVILFGFYIYSTHTFKKKK